MCAVLTQSWNVQHVGNASVAHLHIRQVLLSTLLHNLLQRLGHFWGLFSCNTPIVWVMKSLRFQVFTTQTDDEVATQSGKTKIRMTTFDLTRNKTGFLDVDRRQ